MFNHLVIFAGGLGSRISEESHLVPKPMIELGGLPIIMHIMDYYSKFGVQKFTILAGYKKDFIRRYFRDLQLTLGDVLFDYENENISITSRSSENNQRRKWVVEVLDTGLHSNTSQRLAQLDRSKLLDENGFFLTYGDGLSNVCLKSLYTQHKKSSVVCTLTAVKPPARFGALSLQGTLVAEFAEKRDNINTYINGGYFCCQRAIVKLCKELGHDMFEDTVLPSVAEKNQLGAFQHDGFWQPMDTMRDKEYLENILQKGKAPWMI